ncbi:hypothetical protein L195_g055208, partial [Trifolium pratense]
MEKGETLGVFKEFKALVEKQVGVPIQILRIDRGGEYLSKEFAEFCSEHGIQRQLTASYTPQQNGVAERKNQTIINMVRSVLLEKGVLRSFWPEAVKWVIHVLNRSPTLAVKNITPEEAWSGLKPSESKAYKLYDPINKKILISRDVKFQEDAAWDWGEAKTSITVDTSELNPLEDSCQDVVETIQNTYNDTAATTSATAPN